MDFLASYQKLCDETGTNPLTVFLSITTIPSASIMALLERLDVVIPPKVRKRLLQSDDMGRESLRIATEVFRGIVGDAERRGIKVPLGLQIEQVGVRRGDLSLRLLDGAYPTLRSA